MTRLPFKILVFALSVLLLAGSFVQAETVVQVRSDAQPTPVRREILGVNQLYYGEDSYGFLIHGTKKAEPELVEILREIGIKSMRYPGGCGGTHNYDWKQSAGLKGDFPGLGLLEFLRVCEEIGAEPMLGLSAFRGSPEEAAEFVEFLNAPNDGRHPWAAKRAELDHPKPYGVRFVEFGNESYHGNHYTKPPQTITSRQYAEKYLAFRAAMQKVDPAIQLGVILHATYWNQGVLDVVGTNFDFAIVHHYHPIRQVEGPGYAGNFGVMDELTAQKEHTLESFPEAKKKDVRLALTEFNATYTEHKHLTAALTNAETLIWLCRDPDYFAAEYWQFVNEGFGMVRGKSGAFVKRPNALAFELVARNLFDRVIPTTQTGPLLSELLPPDVEVEEPEGKDLTEAEMRQNLLPKIDWKQGDRPERTRLETWPDGSIRLEFLTDEGFNYYHTSCWTAIPKWKSVEFHLTAEIRVRGMENSSGIALELGDGRGYTKTRSVAATEGVKEAHWSPVSVTYRPLKDTRSLELKVRRFEGSGKGVAEIRNVKIVPVLPRTPKIPAVETLLTESADGGQMGLLFVNRSLKPETVKFTFPGAFAEVQAETLTADGPFATNERETPDAAQICPLKVKKSKRQLEVELPPHSLTGIRFSRGQKKP